MIPFDPMERGTSFGRIGRYRIMRRVSSGGMGVVFLGVAEGMGGFERQAAIKMLNPEHRDRMQYVAMFLDEARIGARVQHPNLVSVQEIGEHNGELFIAMDYVHGETLSKVIKRHDQQRRQLPIPFVVEVGIAVCDALHAMHRAGVIHGDISPQNILVGYDGIVRVTDFGIAKTDDNMFQAEPATLRGKIAYLAPEQLMGEPQQPACDFFSLGIVLWEAVTAKRMFQADVDPSVGVANRISTIDKIPRPDTIRTDLSEELNAIITKALSPDPKLRYPDARTMGTALRAFQIEHCPSVCSDRWEEYMHELFADRIALREREPSAADDELSELLMPTAADQVPPSFYDAPPPAAPQEIAQPEVHPFAEPIPAPVEETEDVSAEPVTGVWKIQRNRKWIPVVVGFAFTVAILVLAGIPVREKAAPEPPPVVKVAEVKKSKPAKSRPVHRKKRAARPRKPAPLLFGADDL